MSRYCDNCIYCTQRDEGYGEYEWHGLYCMRYYKYDPSPCGDYAETENEEEDDTER